MDVSGFFAGDILIDHPLGEFLDYLHKQGPFPFANPMLAENPRVVVVYFQIAQRSLDPFLVVLLDIVSKEKLLVGFEKKLLKKTERAGVFQLSHNNK
jgi:hypothetical protein